MALGSSSPSAEASHETDVSSASEMQETKKGKFKTTSPARSAQKLRYSPTQGCVTTPPINDPGMQNNRQNYVESCASVAKVALPSISIVPTSVAHDCERKAVTLCNNRKLHSSNDISSDCLTNNKYIKSNVIADGLHSSRREYITINSSCVSETNTSLNDRKNIRRSKIKCNLITACKKSILSKNDITSSIKSCDYLNSSAATTNHQKNNIMSITVRTGKNSTINTVRDNNTVLHSTNNGDIDSSTSPVSNSIIEPSSITIDYPTSAASFQKSNVENGMARNNSDGWAEDEMRCLALDECVGSSPVKVQTQTLPSDRNEKNEKNDVPAKLINVPATHMASQNAMSTEQEESQPNPVLLQGSHDMASEESVASILAEESLNSEIECTTPNKLVSLPHQQQQQETCLHCGAVVEFILSHLVNSRRCQGSYNLDTLLQVAKRCNNSDTAFLADASSSHTLDVIIPPVGASVEVANDESSFPQQESPSNTIQADPNSSDIVSGEHLFYPEQSNVGLEGRGAGDTDGEDFDEPYLLCEASLPNDGRDYTFTPSNGIQPSKQQSSVQVKFQLPPMAASRIVARKVKELSKASVMARKVLKTPDKPVDMVNLVRLHSKGGVPILMRKRKKTLQEEIEEEELEERRRRPVITACLPGHSKFYHRRRAQVEEMQQCKRNHTRTTESVQNKKQSRLSEVPFTESVQIIEDDNDTPNHISTTTRSGVWKQDLLLIEQKLLDFQQRLKVCERLAENTLEKDSNNRKIRGNVCEQNNSDEEDGSHCNNRKQESRLEDLINTANDDEGGTEIDRPSDSMAEDDRLSDSMNTEEILCEEDSGRDFFEANEDWFIPRRTEPGRQKMRKVHENPRIYSKFGIKRKIKARFHSKKQTDSRRRVDVNINNNRSSGNSETPIALANCNEDVEEMPDYFDEDYLRQHCKTSSSNGERQQHQHPSSSLILPPRGRRIHIKRTECKSCGAKIKYILSHLSKSFKCQSLYDMTLLRAQSEQNKKLRQRHYERQHKSIIKERQRQYYHDKREALRNNKKVYYQQNRDTLRERQSEYYDKNYEQQREKKRLYYIQNSERIRERHRRYNTVYRQREWNKRLQLDLIHYRREMMERGEDPDASEQVVEMSQHIMALPTDVEGIKRAMVETGSFCADGDDGRKGKVAIDSWRRNARAWVGGRRLLGTGGRVGSMDPLWMPRQHVSPNTKKAMARVKRLGDSKVIKLTKAGAGAGEQCRADYDFMTAADQVIIKAVGDGELGEEIQHDIEYVADQGGDTALVEEIYIQEEMSHLDNDDGLDAAGQHMEEEVARVGEVQTEIHEDHNHVSFVQTLVDGEVLHINDEDDSVIRNGTLSFGLSGGRSFNRRRRKKRRGHNSYKPVVSTDNTVSIQCTFQTNDQNNVDEMDSYLTNNEEDSLGVNDAHQ